MLRYLARVVLVPFIYDAPSVKVGALDSMLAEAYMAIPEAISIGKWLTLLTQADIYEMVEKLQEVMGGQLEGRLAIQYAMSILCAQQVAVTIFMAITVYLKCIADMM